MIAAAAAHVEKPAFAKTDDLFRAGVKEGFVDGATWADSLLSEENERLARRNAELEGSYANVVASLGRHVNELIRLRFENERLAAAVARLTDHIEELQKTFEK